MTQSPSFFSQGNALFTASRVQPKSGRDAHPCYCLQGPRRACSTEMRAAGGERGRIRNTLALGLGCASVIGCLSLGSVLVAPEKKEIPPVFRTLSSWENNLLLAQTITLSVRQRKLFSFLSLFSSSAQFLPRSTASGVIALGGHTLPHLRTLPKAAPSTFGTSGKGTQRGLIIAGPH